MSIRSLLIEAVLVAVLTLVHFGAKAEVSGDRWALVQEQVCQTWDKSSCNPRRGDIRTVEVKASRALCEIAAERDNRGMDYRYRYYCVRVGR